MRRIICVSVSIFLMGCSSTPDVVVVEPQEVLTDCVYIGIIEKWCDSLAKCEKEAKLSAGEVHATHIVWVKLRPETDRRPAYLMAKVFQCK